MTEKNLKKISAALQDLEYRCNTIDRAHKYQAELIHNAARKYDAIKARAVFIAATIFGIGGGFCINKLLELEGGWTPLGTLAATSVGGLVFAVAAGAWLATYSSMR